MRPLMGALLLAAGLAGAAPTRETAPTPVPMPGGGEGIGFDDLGFAAGSKKIVVPGGRTGKIFLVDPRTRKMSSVAGFTAAGAYKGGHGEGVTSADEGRGLLFGADRNTETLSAVDPKTGKAAASARLSGHPDYVRFVASRGEVWVSEPNSEKIEVFAFSSGEGGTKLEKAADIPVPGGPESLVVDDSRGRAYAHTWKDETVAVGLKSRAVEARWRNGCAGSRGIALDPGRGFVFVGCEEGKAVVLDAARDGKAISSLEAGSGVDVIAFDAGRRHLYLPGADSATMAVLAVADDGKLTLVETVPTAKGAHCVAADGAGGAWVCDPDRGRLLFFKDAGGGRR